MRVYYYLPRSTQYRNELNPLYAEYVELVRESTQMKLKNRLLRELRVDRESASEFFTIRGESLVMIPPLKQCFHGYAPAPNPSYLTLSKRVKRDLFYQTNWEEPWFYFLLGQTEVGFPVVEGRELFIRYIISYCTLAALFFVPVLAF